MVEKRKVDINDLIEKDSQTIEILNRMYGEGKWNALDTKDKRATWRYGFEGGYTGVFSNPDTEKERWHGVRLLHPKQLTENDAYYAALGRCMRKEDGENV